MPIIVVTGAPFSGKGQYVRDEIARRETDGELGIVSVDFTAIYGRSLRASNRLFVTKL